MLTVTEQVRVRAGTQTQPIHVQNQDLVPEVHSPPLHTGQVGESQDNTVCRTASIKVTQTYLGI